MFTPLLQFNMYAMWNLNVLNYFMMYMNNLNVVVLSLLIFLYFMFYLLDDLKLIPNKMQYVLEKMYMFVDGLVYHQVGKKGMKFFPLLFTIFLTMMLLNIMGLLPWGFAVTSHFMVSLHFSLSIGLGIFIVGLYYYKLNYLKIFLQDMPILLYPLMIIIELSSYIISAFSLSISLSANIMAGHILSDIIAEVIAYFNFIFFDLSFLFFGLFMVLFLLEIGVASLQSYVFVLLITIYLNDAVNLNSHV